MLGLYNLHHRSIRVQNWGFYVLDPARALGMVPLYLESLSLRFVSLSGSGAVRQHFDCELGRVTLRPEAGSQTRGDSRKQICPEQKRARPAQCRHLVQVPLYARTSAPLSRAQKNCGLAFCTKRQTLEYQAVHDKKQASNDPGRGPLHPLAPTMSVQLKGRTASKHLFTCACCYNYCTRHASRLFKSILTGTNKSCT